MISDHARHAILIPVLDGDISETVLADAREALAHDDVRLVLVHVMSDRRPREAACPAAARRDAAARASARAAAASRAGLPRWRRLVADVAPDRVFVDTMPGSVADVIRAERDRFQCERVLCDAPVPAGPRRHVLQELPC